MKNCLSFLSSQRPLHRAANSCKLNYRFFSSQEYTHILIGGGSAGCVLANRLSSDPSNKVLLLEAGRNDLDYNFWKIYMPAALTYNLMDSKYNWFYHTVEQENMLGRRLYHPRGKVLGGGSSLNAMVYIRGHAFDYDRWAKREGCKGWGYVDCLPYFKKSEAFDGGEDAYRGSSGLLSVQTGRCDNVLHHAFMKAGVEAGYEQTDDINGYQQNGFGRFQMTIGNGMRCSTARAYLRPAWRSRGNLAVKTQTAVSRLLFDGDKAIGVQCASGRVIRLVDKEKGMVILSAGAFNTPHLLMLSGIGPAAHLEANGITVRTSLLGVGQNLQDHLEFYAQWRCKEPITLLSAMTPMGMLKTGMQWLLTREGAGASSHLESGAFTKTLPSMKHPDIQWHFLPALVENHGRSAAKFHAFQLHIGTLRPTSRGFVSLNPNNPLALPVVQPNYLSNDRDIIDLEICLRQAREVINQPAFDAYRGEELRPGKAIKTREQIINFLRESCETAYHPSCTCKMGSKEDPMAVVDPETLNVWGYENLKVVDASIMPSIVSGNLNGPVVMMAEKASDMLMNNALLAPTKVPVYDEEMGFTV